MPPRLVRVLPGQDPGDQPPAPVQVDMEPLIAAVKENTAVQRAILAELQKKKQWDFRIAKDQAGRPFQVDAKQV